MLRAELWSYNPPFLNRIVIVVRSVFYSDNSASLHPASAARPSSPNILPRLYPALFLRPFPPLCGFPIAKLLSLGWRFQNRSKGSAVCSQIYASKTDVEAFLAKLKITPCPHCKKTGFLIKHGSLIGFVPNKLGETVRAARAVRIFCSNRHLAIGCGRTFSVWTADKIKHLFLCADSLWQFLSNAVDSGNKIQAFRVLKCSLSDSAAYRIWRRFLGAQVAIRTALNALCEPPRIESNSPAQLTLAHLAKAFREHTLSPIAAFAATLQTFFI